MTPIVSSAVQSPLAQLVLARLALPAKSPPSATVVRKDIAKVSGQPLSAEEYAELTIRLLADGLIEPRPRSRGAMQLTEAGRAAALEYLGVNEFPPRTNWTKVRAQYLLSKALGIDKAEAAKLKGTEEIGAFLVRREYDLSEGATVKQALEALVCQLVGRPDESSLDGLFRAVLSEKLGVERLTAKDLVKQFPCKLSGARSTKVDDLRSAIVADWLRRQLSLSIPKPISEPEPFDLPAFAATVKRMARDSAPAARFGANKAFIVAVWRDSQAEQSFPRMTLAEFKSALAEASRLGLLRLEPADLVQAMDPQLVADSVVVRAGAAFHFVLIEEPTP